MVRESGTIFTAACDEILLGDLAVGEPRFGDRGDDALLDFGAGPADGELRQLVEIEPGQHPRRGG